MKTSLSIRIAGWVVAMWLLGHAALIAIHVVVVFVYSAAVEPGLENADYQAFALASGPWVSILVGGPVFYAIGRFLDRRVGAGARRAGLIVWALYSVTDLTIVLLSGAPITLLLSAQWIASQGIKLAAILLATRQPV